MRSSMAVVALALTVALIGMHVVAASRLSELAGTWQGNWGTVVPGGATGAGGPFTDPSHRMEVTWRRDGTGSIGLNGVLSGTIACDAPDSAGGLITCTIRRSDGMIQGMTGVLKPATTTTAAGAKGGVASADEFVGSYVHFNVAGLFTTMYLRRTHPPSPPPPRHTVLACESTRAYLACTNDTRLHVVEVLYGRDDARTCAYPYSSDPAFVRDTQCRFGAARDVVTRVCGSAPNTPNACTVEASNTAMGVDPCVNTYKYLRITYECVSA